MFVSQGVLTATGGMTSHAAVVGRQMGKPSIVGAGELEVDEKRQDVHVGGQTLKEGDYVSFDGLTGEVKIGQVATKPSEILQVLDGKMKPEESDIYQRFNKLLSWADKVRPARHPRQRRPAGPGGARLRVRRARHRPVPHRAHVLRRGPHPDRPADDPRRQRGGPARGARPSCCRCSAATSTASSRRCTAAPVTIRTIDPPLHEFLPKREDLMVEIAQLEATGGRRARSSTRSATLLRRVEQLHEFNPMLGHRGVRLGITYPEITEMQTRAIIEAACQLDEGRAARSCPEIMIPLVGHVKELRDQKADRRPRGRGGDEGAGRQDQVPRRHDDRGAARRRDGRRDRRRRRSSSRSAPTTSRR